MERARRVGMAWLTRDDYVRILEIMEDAKKLPESYDQWLLSAEQVEETVSGTGIAVVRVAIEPRAFAEWCADRGLRRDGAARSRFAVENAERSAHET